MSKKPQILLNYRDLENIVDKKLRKKIMNEYKFSEYDDLQDENLNKTHEDLFKTEIELLKKEAKISIITIDELGFIVIKDTNMKIPYVNIKPSIEGYCSVKGWLCNICPCEQCDEYNTCDL
jgi:hypothetical protein